MKQAAGKTGHLPGSGRRTLSRFSDFCWNLIPYPRDFIMFIVAAPGGPGGRYGDLQIPFRYTAVLLLISCATGLSEIGGLTDL